MEMPLKLTDKQWADAFLHFRREFQVARAKVQADAEDYMAVWQVVESLGKYLKANNYADELADLKAGKALLNIFFPSPKSVPISYQRLCKARNAHVHEGAVSRTLGTHAMRLSLDMEEALMKEMKKLNDSNDQSVKAWMVPEPVVAQPWHTVSEIRVTLLSGGYSALPFWWKKEEKQKEGWYFIRDISVVRYLRSKGDPHCALSSVVHECEKCAPKKLCLVPCKSPIKPDTSVQSLLKNGAFKNELPILVVDSSVDPSRLLGILTPHDLLI